MNELLTKLLLALHQCPARSGFDSDLDHYRAIAAWWKAEIAPHLEAIDHRLEERQKQAEAKARLVLEIAELPPHQGCDLLGLAL